MTEHRNGRQVPSEQDATFIKQSHGRNSGPHNPNQKEDMGPKGGQKFSQTASDFTLAEQAEKAQEIKPFKKEEELDFGSASLKKKKGKSQAV